MDAGHRISIFDLRAYYGAEEAVQGVTIEFPAHQVSAIIGPSGCGKSTLLRCINRMHEEIPGAHAEGQVMLDDHDLYASDVNVTAVRRLIGMVFQNPDGEPSSDDVNLRECRVRTQTDRQHGQRPTRARQHLDTRGRALG
jgi:ABC-type phosphate transport system ATPase subunit